jgi:hypothetical protein
MQDGFMRGINDDMKIRTRDATDESRRLDNLAEFFSGRALGRPWFHRRSFACLRTQPWCHVVSKHAMSDICEDLDAPSGSLVVIDLADEAAGPLSVLNDMTFQLHV